MFHWVSVTIGTPGQEVAFLINFESSDTWALDRVTLLEDQFDAGLPLCKYNNALSAIKI
jgi:hypothetical protein